MGKADDEEKDIDDFQNNRLSLKKGPLAQYQSGPISPSNNFFENLAQSDNNPPPLVRKEVFIDEESDNLIEEAVL